MAGTQGNLPLTYNLGLKSSGFTLMPEEGRVHSRWNHLINWNYNLGGGSMSL